MKSSAAAADFVTSVKGGGYTGAMNTQLDVFGMNRLFLLLFSLSELWYTKVPKILRYGISGNLGNVGVYMCEQAVYRLLRNRGGGAHDHPAEKLPLILLPPNLLPHVDTISFFVGYLLAVPSQHLLHAILVYGVQSINSMEKYATTLIGMYSAMIAACTGSTIMNTSLLKYTNIPKGWAFILTMFTFSFFNYFVIGWIVRQSNDSTATLESSSNPQQPTMPTPI